MDSGQEKLSEMSAWLYIARKWDRAKPKMFTYSNEVIARWVVETKTISDEASVGLCASVTDLYDIGRIDATSYNTMLKKIENYREEHNKHGLYIWPTTSAEGARERAEFCRVEAALIMESYYWFKMAKLWEEAQPDQYGNYAYRGHTGLCGLLYSLDVDMPLRVYRNMKSRIRTDAPKYFWSMSTLEGKLERIKFCKTQGERC